MMPIEIKLGLTSIVGVFALMLLYCLIPSHYRRLQQFIEKGINYILAALIVIFMYYMLMLIWTSP